MREGLQPRFYRLVTDVAVASRGRSYRRAVLATVTTFAVYGIDSKPVTVEVDIRSRGLPAFTIVGLPDRAVRESRERVRAALKNSGFDFPEGRITVNLAPADLRKAGPAFDLALAVGLLSASGQIPDGSTADCAVCGEVSLTGALRPVRGALAVALGARTAGVRRLLVPADVAPEAALIDDVEVLAMPDLEDIAAYFRGESNPERARPAPAVEDADAGWALDLADVRG